MLFQAWQNIRCAKHAQLDILTGALFQLCGDLKDIPVCLVLTVITLT
jgi:hypothetical protein